MRKRRIYLRRRQIRTDNDAFGYTRYNAGGACRIGTAARTYGTETNPLYALRGLVPDPVRDDLCRRIRHPNCYTTAAAKFLVISKSFTNQRKNMLINLKNQAEEMQTRLLELGGYL